MPEAVRSSRAKSGHRLWLSSVSASSFSSPGSVSIAAASMPAAAQLAPRPALPRSYTVTGHPDCARRHAMPSPITPAPTMTVFGRGDETIFGAVIADSLHRARPARFSGFNLSRSCRAPSAAGLGGTPASCQFRTETLPMQGFSCAAERRADPSQLNYPSLRERGVPPPPLGLARTISAVAKEWKVV